MPSRVLKHSTLIALAALGLTSLALAGCGVRGAPAVPPPLFGDTDMAPGVPSPYQRQDRPASVAMPAAIPPESTDTAPGEDED